MGPEQRYRTIQETSDLQHLSGGDGMGARVAKTNIDGFTSSVARCTEEAQTRADTPNFHIDCFFIMRKQNKKSSFDLGGLHLVNPHASQSGGVD